MRIYWRDSSMSVRKWLKALAVVLGMFVLVYVVAKPVVHAYLVVRAPRRQWELTEEAVGRPVERVSFQAVDGVDLVGWFVPGDGGGATIVISHGSQANGPITYPGSAFLNRAGYSVLVYDNRGNGHSGGDASTLGPREVRDLRGAVAYLQTRADVDAERIGAMGCSMGSATTIGAAAEDPAIKAAVAEAVYADARDLWDRFGYVSIRNTPIHWTWGPLLRLSVWMWTGEWVADFRPEALIGQISPRPVFIIHGEHDNGACTVSDARRLYAAANEPKELWIVPGAGHCGAHYAHTEEYERRVLAFFDRWLRAE
jgi:dipeptidyl aminopeptidase/acylaminoacyl peptidase